MQIERDSGRAKALKRLSAYAGRLLRDEYGLGACGDPEMAMHLSEGSRSMTR